MNETNKKRLKGATSATLAAALLVSGSLAWRDVSQHKTNKFQTKAVSQSMVLVEKFTEKADWKPGEVVENTVFVRNGQDTDDVNKYIYSDGYVRLQLREFLGKSTPKIKWSEYRYLIDTKGDHVMGKTEAEAQTAAEAIWPNATYTIEQVATPMDEGNGAPVGGYFYVRTDETAPNGIYGKFIMIENKPGETVSYLDETKKIDMDVLDKDQAGADTPADHEAGTPTEGHNNPNASGNYEDKDDYYTTHSWKTDNKISEMIDLGLGENIVLLSEFDGNPGKFWILDDSNDSGWAYWGERVSHNNVGSIENNSITHNLLESVSLKDTSDALVYRLHINMSAVSYSDMDSETEGWGTIPTSIKEAYGKQENTPVINKTKLEVLISEARELDQNKYTSKSWVNANLVAEIKTAEEVYNDENSTQENVDKAVIDLSDSLAKLVKIPEVGEKIEKFGLKWQVVAVENENVMIIHETDLTKEQLEFMGIEPLEFKGASSQFFYNGVKYFDTVDNRQPYVPYSESNLKVVDTAFFDAYIKNHKDLNLVKKVTINDEIYDSKVDFKTTVLNPTIMSEDGVQTAFSISTSDFNLHSMNKLGNGIKIPNSVFMRSPADSGQALAVYNVNEKNSVSGSLMSAFYARPVRPAMWISLD